MNGISSAGFTRYTLPNTWLAVLVVGAAISVGACGSPSEPSRTIADLRITGPSAVLISQSANYTAAATYADGTSSEGIAAWTSSSTAVAEVSSGGQLTALTAGSTNISASFEGRTATLAVQITNPLVGQWVLTASANPGNPSGIGTRRKTFTEDTWVVQQTAATGSVVFRHGGRYTLRGTEYSETVEFANPSTANLIGRTFTATLSLTANQFTQSAPIAETWSRVQ